MAIHGSQGILNGQRQPKPRNKYAVPRYRVTLVHDNRATPPSSPLTTSVSAAAILRPLFAGLDREQFLVCGLDAKHAIIGVNIVSIGSLTLAIVHPREVFKPLILMNAAGWICAHNHPSGVAEPSQADELITARLRDALALIDVRVLDHFVVTGDDVVSFAERGLL